MSGGPRQIIPSPELWGPGTFVDNGDPDVPRDSQRVFELLAQTTPGFPQDRRLWDSVSFEGSSDPITPGPLKAPVVAAALHAMCGVVAKEILEARDGPYCNHNMIINTDHAAFWLGTVSITRRNGVSVPQLARSGKLGEIFPKDLEKDTFKTPLRLRTTACYPTKKDGMWFQLHGSLDADPVLQTIGLDPSTRCDSLEDAYKIIGHHVRQFGPEELEMLHVQRGLCGTMCYTPKAWRETKMHKEISKCPLVNYKHEAYVAPTPAVPFPVIDGDKRPLAGIKVVELVRIIAGPVIGNTLASLGADVIRINCSRLPDFNTLQLTLNAGVRTTDLDLNKEEDLSKVKKLIEEADVFIQGYRPGALEKKGLGLHDVLEMASRRGKGIVYVEENCYGPKGPFQDRPGWQQVADAASGCSYVTGKYLGHTDGTCILPALPVPDMLTGVVGAIGTMMALRDRSRNGGSYHVFASLMAAASLLLDPEVGLYPPEVTQRCDARFKWGHVDPQLFVLELLSVVIEGWQRELPQYFGPDSPWITKLNGEWGQFEILKPVLQFVDQDLSPRWSTAPLPNCRYERDEISFLHSKPLMINGHL
ncbi:uncharacterized protein PV09_04093 [Verruconis gallopava]|uniref:Alpha methylacyl-CoA racemase n=1 Tax=Verruconis gallopava TaxID=253628 RepID=A0A0D2B0R6_9PEZI|nr:uncharacterized protein PV09_04093 [Verruconis gallopava]KIW04924.1 hypothetical protein PV09_04093 [Verruconis gallopava]